MAPKIFTFAACLELLDLDLRNNSAWNQRWFAVHESGVPVTDEIINRELNFALRYLEKALDNESPWNYIRGYGTLLNKEF